MLNESLSIFAQERDVIEFRPELTGDVTRRSELREHGSKLAGVVVVVGDTAGVEEMKLRSLFGQMSDLRCRRFAGRELADVVARSQRSGDCRGR